MTEHDGNDTALIDRACAGDERALETLLRAHQAWIFNLALRMVWRHEDAEDATQEILTKIATQLSSFRGESAPCTWMYRIAVNHLLTMRRRRSEESVQSFDVYAERIHACPDEDLEDASFAVDAEILEITPQAFRKRLSRARRDLSAFMQVSAGSSTGRSSACASFRRP